MRIFGLILILSLLSGCSTAPQQITPTQRARDSLTDNSNITLKSMVVGDFQLQYAEAGDLGKPTIVFIHGTSGSWRSLGRLMISPQFNQRTRLISIDRPGWGGSPLMDKETEGSFAAQVALIEPLLSKVKAESGGQPLILVGHSYGASISPYNSLYAPGARR